jgi:hypothetical protein
MKSLVRFLLLSLLLGSAVFVVTGCATTEPENRSERPWASPKGWETGLPSSINEGR